LFQLNSEHNYVVPEWAGYDWLRHGFGTERSAIPGALATVKQIHSAEVLIADQPGLQGTGDGLITTAGGLLVGVKTADCLPILVVDPTHLVVAAVHAGWRGTAAGIVGRVIESMKLRFRSDPADLEAAIGPGIGECCFQVGPEVAREFGPWESNEKTCLNLTQINRLQLQKAGVRKVYESGLCTKCGEGFYSFRRDGDKAGRMVSFVGIR
jgi:polyphenol oxidase